jgi:hypothetical protein
MKSYILAVRNYPWLLPSIEESLRAINDGEVKEVSKLAKSLRMASGRPVSEDEALVALSALCDLGIFDRAGIRYSFNKKRFEETVELRRGIHGAIATFADASQPVVHQEAQLCVSLPPSLSRAAEHVIRESSTDLRSSLLDVVAGAKESLIVASPFWDADTTAEMISLARKKLSIGIQVCLLGRFSRDLPPAVRSELRKIAHEKQCSILSWFEGAGAETQTFHFKAITADRGQRAYMGSANMTVSSLRSRMELGVILKGEPAAQLDRILRVVITMATPISA